MRYVICLIVFFIFFGCSTRDEEVEVTTPPSGIIEISEECCTSGFYGEDLGTYFFSLDCVELDDIEPGAFIKGSCIYGKRIVTKKIRDEEEGYLVLITDSVECSDGEICGGI